MDLYAAKNPSTFDLIWMAKTDDIDPDMRIRLKIIFYFSGLYFILTVGATLRAQYLILWPTKTCSTKLAIWIMIICYNDQFLFQKRDFSAYCAEILSL